MKANTCPLIKKFTVWNFSGSKPFFFAYFKFFYKMRDYLKSFDFFNRYIDVR